MSINRPFGSSLATSFQTFREKLLSGLIWNGISALSLQGANLVASVLLAHLLGLEVFGAYSLLIATVAMVANFAQGGCGLVATKLVAENLGVNPTSIGSILRLCTLLTAITGTISTILLMVFAQEFSTHALERPELKDQVRIAALSIIFQATAIYQTGALQGFAAFKELSKASALSGLASIASLGIGANFGGLTGALIGYTLATALRTLICWLSLRRVRIQHGILGTAQIRREHISHLWHIALPAGLAGMVTVPAQWIVNLAISRLPMGLSLVGIFAVATQIRQVALQTPTLLNSVTFAVMSKAKGSGMRTELRRIYIANFAANLLLGLATSLFVAIFAQGILSFWRATSEESIRVTRILAISIVPELMAMSAYQLVQSSGRMWASLLQIAIPRDTAYLVIALFFLPAYGLAAVATAYFAAQLVGLSATLLTVRQTCTMAPKDVYHPCT